MAILTQQIIIEKIVPRFTMKAGNIRHIITTGKSGFTKKSPTHLYKTKNEGTFSIDQIRKNIEKHSKINEITWWMLVELNENDYEIYVKPHIVSDKENRFFHSDNELEFFLEYNKDMIEFTNNLTNFII